MNFTKMSDSKLFELYRAMHEGYHHDVLQEAYKEDGIPKTIMNLFGAISERWYKEQDNKQLRPKLGEEIWYLEFKYEKPEHGHVYKIFYDEDGDIISIDVIFSDTNNIRTFYGFDIGKCLFCTKEEAQLHFIKNKNQ